MEAEFWHETWAKGKLGFHEGAANALLSGAENLFPEGRIFVPLCGKTRDIAWLLARGRDVVGVELSETAVEALFDDMGIAPEVAQAGALRRYRAAGLDIFVGDFFDLTEAILGPVDAVYDRAAFVALPEGMRRDYAARIGALTKTAPQVVITLTYDQTVMEGPPFSISEAELKTCYGAAYAHRLHSERMVEVRGLANVSERLWQLVPR